MNPLALTVRAAYWIRGAVYRAIILSGGGACGAGLRVEAGFRLRHGAHNGLSIGKNVYVGFGTVFDCPPPGKLSIGDSVTLTHGIFISASKSVVIGDGTLIGEYVSIRDANHQTSLSAPIQHQPMLAQGCEIGSDVWIGRGCAILAGAKLEQGCVIGANSVVLDEIPRNSIAVGAPARVVGARSE